MEEHKNQGFNCTCGFAYSSFSLYDIEKLRVCDTVHYNGYLEYVRATPSQVVVDAYFRNLHNVGDEKPDFTVNVAQVEDDFEEHSADVRQEAVETSTDEVHVFDNEVYQFNMNPINTPSYDATMGTVREFVNGDLSAVLVGDTTPTEPMSLYLSNRYCAHQRHLNIKKCPCMCFLKEGKDKWKIGKLGWDDINIINQELGLDVYFKTGATSEYQHHHIVILVLTTSDKKFHDYTNFTYRQWRAIYRLREYYGMIIDKGCKNRTQRIVAQSPEEQEAHCSKDAPGPQTEATNEASAPPEEEAEETEEMLAQCSGLRAKLEDLAAKLKTNVVSAFKSMGSLTKYVWDHMKDSFGFISDKVYSFFGSLADKMLNKFFGKLKETIISKGVIDVAGEGFGLVALLMFIMLVVLSAIGVIAYKVGKFLMNNVMLIISKITKFDYQDYTEKVKVWCSESYDVSKSYAHDKISQVRSLPKYFAQGPYDTPIVAIITLLGVGFGAKDQTLEGVAKSCRSFSAIVAGGLAVSNFMVSCMMILPTAIRKFCNSLSTSKEAKEKNLVEDWLFEATVVMKASQIPEVLSSDVYYEQVMKTSLQGRQFLSTYKVTSPTVMNMVSRLLMPIEKLKANIIQFRNGGVSRALPFCVHFAALPGYGKTLVASLFLMLVGGFEPKDVYTRNYSDEYWSGYISQDVVFLDEFLIGNEKLETMAQEYLTLVSPAVFKPAFPTLDNPTTGIKGTEVRPKMVLSANNSCLFDVDRFNKEALNRRRKYVVHFVQNDEFKKSNPKLWKNGNEIDISAMTKEQISQVAWLKFNLCNPVTGDAFLRDLTWPQLIAYTRQQYTDHQDSCSKIFEAFGMKDQSNKRAQAQEILATLRRSELGVPDKPVSVTDSLTELVLGGSGFLAQQPEPKPTTKRKLKKNTTKLEREYAGLLASSSSSSGEESIATEPADFKFTVEETAMQNMLVDIDAVKAGSSPPTVVPVPEKIGDLPSSTESSDYEEVEPKHVKRPLIVGLFSGESDLEPIDRLNFISDHVTQKIEFLTPQLKMCSREKLHDLKQAVIGLKYEIGTYAERYDLIVPHRVEASVVEFNKSQRVAVGEAEKNIDLIANLSLSNIVPESAYSLICGSCGTKFAARDNMFRCSTCIKLGKSIDVQYVKFGSKFDVRREVFIGFDEEEEMAQKFLSEAFETLLNKDVVIGLWDCPLHVGEGRLISLKSYSKELIRRSAGVALTFLIIGAIQAIRNGVTGEKIDMIDYKAQGSHSDFKNQRDQNTRPQKTVRYSSSAGFRAQGPKERNYLNIAKRNGETTHDVKYIPIQDNIIAVYRHAFCDTFGHWNSENAHITIIYSASEYNFQIDQSMVIARNVVKECEVEGEMTNQTSLEDLLLIFIPRTVKMPHFKNIMKDFCTETELNSLRATYVVVDTDKMRQRASARMVEEVTYGLGYNKSTDLCDSYIELPYGYIYSGRFAKGDCGSIVRTDGQIAPGKILGMHVAGGEGQGICIPITANYLREAIASRNEPEYLEPVPFYGQSPEAKKQSVLYDPLFVLYPNVAAVEKVPRSEQVHMTRKTGVKPSILHVLEKPKKKLPILSKFDDRAFGEDPAKRMLVEAMDVEREFVDLEVLNRAGTDFLIELQSTWRWPLGKRSLTIEEAIGGIPGYLSSLKVNTSAGYPLCLTTKKRGKTAFWNYGTDGTLEIDQDFRDRVMEHQRLLSDGKIPDMRFLGFLKDEPISEKKEREGRCRIIYAADVVANVSFRMTFGMILVGLKASWKTSCSAVGMNQYSDDMHVLYMYLRQVGTKFIAGDFKNFDKNMPPSFQDMAYKIVKSLYGTKEISEGDKPTERQWKQFLANQTLSPIQMEDVKVWMRCSHFSGLFFTTLVNIVVQGLMMRYVFAIHASHLQYADHVRDKMLGDDGVICVSDLAAPYFNASVIEQELKSIGVTYTDDKKSGNVAAFREFKDITFLGAHPILYYGRYLGAMKKDTIIESMLWTRNDNLTIVQEVENMCEYSAAWGKSYYRDVCNRYLGYLSSFCGLKVKTMPSWESMIVILKQRRAAAFEDAYGQFELMDEEYESPAYANDTWKTVGRYFAQAPTLTTVPETEVINTVAPNSGNVNKLRGEAINQTPVDLDYGNSSEIFRGTFVWKNIDEPGKTITEWNAPFGLLELGDEANVQNMPFHRYTYFTFDTMKVKFQITGTPFLSGILAVYYVPLADYDIEIANITNATHVLIQPHNNTVFEMDIPFVYMRSALNTHGKEFLGQLKVAPLAKLQMGNSGQDEVSISVYTSFQGLKFMIPKSHGLSPHAKKVGYGMSPVNVTHSNGLKAAIKYRAQGASQSSNITNNYSNVGGTMPISDVVNSADGTTEQEVSPSVKVPMPLDNPPVASGAFPVEPAFPGMSTSYGAKSTRDLQLYPTAFSRKQMEIFAPEDSKIETILGKRSLLTTVEVKVSTQVNSLLLGLELNSTLSVKEGNNIPTNIAALNQFMFWRCDISLEFLCAKTEYHSMKLQAVTAFGTDLIDSNDRVKCNSKVLDFTGPNDKSEVLIPWNAATEFLRTFEGHGAVDPSQNYSLGMFSVYLLNKLVAPITVSGTVPVLVFVRFLNPKCAVLRGLSPFTWNDYSKWSESYAFRDASIPHVEKADGAWLLDTENINNNGIVYAAASTVEYHPPLNFPHISGILSFSGQAFPYEVYGYNSSGTSKQLFTGACQMSLVICNATQSAVAKYIVVIPSLRVKVEGSKTTFTDSISNKTYSFESTQYLAYAFAAKNINGVGVITESEAALKQVEHIAFAQAAAMMNHKAFWPNLFLSDYERKAASSSTTTTKAPAQLKSSESNTIAVNIRNVPGIGILQPISNGQYYDGINTWRPVDASKGFTKQVVVDPRGYPIYDAKDSQGRFYAQGPDDFEADEEPAEVTPITHVEPPTIPCRLEIGSKFEFCVADIHEIGRRYVKFLPTDYAGFDQFQVNSNLTGISDKLIQNYPTQLQSIWRGLYAAWAGSVKYRFFSTTVAQGTDVSFSPLMNLKSQVSVPIIDAFTGSVFHYYGNKFSTDATMAPSLPFEKMYPLNGLNYIDVSVPFQSHLNFCLTSRTMEIGPISSGTLSVVNADTDLQCFTAFGDDLRLGIFRPPKKVSFSMKGFSNGVGGFF
ncbi:hypothetical protein [Wuhan insect virus 10]|uniref:hypothetical protein n=1 Tax=Wuhan insect virus 10 TaxID=1923714 RepID=UPI00090ADF07|nr:hypothetical protein [Wuhan insect virus 10]APG78423.1 hypothetical protein [Wuhan insect virus 10]